MKSNAQVVYLRLIISILLILYISFNSKAQWAATQIASSTYNSTLRPMSQGVYDPISDKSFFCFMQDGSDPYVVTCDHSTGSHTWGTPQRVLVQPSAEKYNYPTIDILPDRRLVLCCATPFDEALGFSISTNPADASSWTTQTVDIGTRHHVEYPRIKVDRQGHIYLFFIHQDDSKAAHKRWYYYVKSTDCGQSWTTPALSIQRELDDPNGMCELYVGYTASEPYRLDEPERWWFAYTSSSGFQYTGTHTGADNSSQLIVDSPGWTSTSGFTYRWLYNITKNTNSGISSATLTSVTPSSIMDWDTGDKYGIAYHNIYHADVYVVYFRPDNGHWYDAAHNDLGTTVSRAEMETPTARPYITPLPYTSKDVGYVPILTVNEQGRPTAEQDGVFYTWDGSGWATSTPTPNGDIRYFWYTDDNYYMARGRFNIYNSPSMSMTEWNNVANITLPNNHGYSAYGVPVKEGHSMALFNVHEYDADYPGFAWAVSQSNSQTAAAIVLRTPKPVIGIKGSTNVNAIVTDKLNGARSRIRNASNEITLTVMSGNAEIAPSTKVAINGLAEFVVTHTGTSSETIVVKATSPTLADYYLNIYVDTSIASAIEEQPNSNSQSAFSVFPNPINPNSSFTFSVQNGGKVQLNIVDMNGITISTLLNEYLIAGTYQIDIIEILPKLTKGVYVAKLKFEDYETTLKFLK